MSDSILLNELHDLIVQMKFERTSFEDHWRELGNNMMPRRVQFVPSRTNTGDKRNSSIKDETPLLAARTLKSGMMGSITSPARTWFKLSLEQSEVNVSNEIKEWLHAVSDRMRTIFLRSNLYHALPVLYGDLGVFGTGVMGVEEDFTGKVLRFMPFPVGSYSIATNGKLEVDTFSRELQLTVTQIVSKFGIFDKNGKLLAKNLSENVLRLWESSNHSRHHSRDQASGRGSWIDVSHVVRPNLDWDSEDPTSFKFNSYYFETSEHEKFLSKSGFNFFPILAPRWEVTGEDVYGTNCPGMEALPAVKQLHKMETRGLQAIEKMINPPMIGPPELKLQKASVLPGDITYIDSLGSNNPAFRPIYEIQYPVGEHEAKQETIRQRIRETFFHSLFQIFSDLGNRDRVTATEIQAKRDEKLLILGPTLERLNQDLLNPLIDITFDIMVRQGLVPAPPQELQGQPLKVDYLSILHQAQKITNLSGLDRLKIHASEVGQVSPELLDKIDFDRMTDDYANILGVDPNIMRSDEEVAQIRQARAEAQQAQEVKAQQLAETETAAKALGAISE